MLAVERFSNPFFQNPDMDPVVFLVRTDDGRHWQAFKDGVPASTTDIRDIEFKGGWEVRSNDGTNPFIASSIQKALDAFQRAGWDCPVFMETKSGALKAIEIPGTTNRFLSHEANDVAPVLGR